MNPRGYRFFTLLYAHGPATTKSQVTDPKIMAMVKNIRMMHSSSVSQKRTCNGADRY